MSTTITFDGSPGTIPRRKRAASKAPLTGSVEKDDELFQTVRAAVVARLGDSMDPKLLDTIIQRVIQNVGAK